MSQNHNAQLMMMELRTLSQKSNCHAPQLIPGRQWAEFVVQLAINSLECAIEFFPR